MVYRFADPQYLFLLTGLPILGYWYWKWRTRHGGTIRYSQLDIVKPAVKARAMRFRHALFGLRVLALATLCAPTVRNFRRGRYH
jgi:hypothetical protein